MNKVFQQNIGIVESQDIFLTKKKKKKKKKKTQTQIGNPKM
jgi:hypothetical protein